MVKWEYLEVQALIAKDLEQWPVKGAIFHANGVHEKFENKKGDAIAKLGEAGWELVSTSIMPSFGVVISQPMVLYTFKREIKEKRSKG